MELLTKMNGMQAALFEKEKSKLRDSTGKLLVVEVDQETKTFVFPEGSLPSPYATDVLKRLNMLGGQSNVGDQNLAENVSVCFHEDVLQRVNLAQAEGLSSVEILGIMRIIENQIIRSLLVPEEGEDL